MSDRTERSIAEQRAKDLAEGYFDPDGNPITLLNLVRAEPEWAANVIRSGRALAKLGPPDVVREFVEAWLDAQGGEDATGDPRDPEWQRWIAACNALRAAREKGGAS